MTQATTSSTSSSRENTHSCSCSTPHHTTPHRLTPKPVGESVSEALWSGGEGQPPQSLPAHLQLRLVDERAQAVQHLAGRLRRQPARQRAALTGPTPARRLSNVAKPRPVIHVQHRPGRQPLTAAAGPAGQEAAPVWGRGLLLLTGAGCCRRPVGRGGGDGSQGGGKGQLHTTASQLSNHMLWSGLSVGRPTCATGGSGVLRCGCWLLGPSCQRLALPLVRLFPPPASCCCLSVQDLPRVRSMAWPARPSSSSSSSGST